MTQKTRLDTSELRHCLGPIMTGAQKLYTNKTNRDRYVFAVDAMIVLSDCLYMATPAQLFPLRRFIRALSKHATSETNDEKVHAAEILELEEARESLLKSLGPAPERKTK